MGSEVRKFVSPPHVVMGAGLLRLLLRMRSTSQALLDVPAYCGRRSGMLRILEVCMPLWELVRPEWEEGRDQRVGEIREGPCVAPGSGRGRRCLAVGKRLADPGGTLGCSTRETGYQEASAGWRNHRTGESLLGGGIGLGGREAGRQGLGTRGRMRTSRGSCGVVYAAAGGARVAHARWVRSALERRELSGCFDLCRAEQSIKVSSGNDNLREALRL